MYNSDLAVCLKSLWQLKISFKEDLSEKTKQRIFEIIKNERTNFTVQTFVSIFYSFSHLGLQWHDLNYDFDTEINEDRPPSSSTLPFWSSNNVKDVFLTGVSTYETSMNSKQVTNLIFVFRTMEIDWEHFNQESRYNLLSKLILTLDVATPGVLGSILLFLSSSNIFYSVQENVEKNVETKVGNKVILSKNEIYVEKNEESSARMKNLLFVLEDQILKSTRNIIEKEANIKNDGDNGDNNVECYMSKLDAKIILDSFKKLKFFDSLDEKSKSFLLNRILSDPTSRNYLKVKDKNEMIKDNINISKKSMLTSLTSRSSASSDRMYVRSADQTFLESATKRNNGAVSTDSVLSVHSFDLTKSLVSAGVEWNDLNHENQENYITILEKQFCKENINKNKNVIRNEKKVINKKDDEADSKIDKSAKESSPGQFISFLRGLHTLGIPWSKIPTEAQHGILDCSVTFHEFNTNYNNNDKNKNDRNKENNNNVNKVGMLQSFGLDLLSSLSAIGCQWSHITEHSVDYGNILLSEACKILSLSETILTAKITKNDNFYSEGVRDRMRRHLKYGCTFVSTYNSLNIEFSDLNILTEKTFFRSTYILLESVLNSEIMAYDNEVDYCHNDNSDDRNVDDMDAVSQCHAENSDSDNMRINNDKISIGDLMNDIDYEASDTRHVDYVDNVTYQESENDSNHCISNIKNDIDNDYIDNNVQIKSSTLDPEQEFKLIEDMRKKNSNENHLEDQLLSPIRRKADLDFLDEISKVSALSKKSKFLTGKEKILFLKTSLPTVNIIYNNGDQEVKIASDCQDIKNNGEEEEESVNSRETVINSFREQGEASDTVKKYKNIAELKIENVFEIFLEDKNLWKEMSKKTKTDFSNKLCDIFIKFDNLHYMELSKEGISESRNSDLNSTRGDNEENLLQLYSNENKKYFYFLNLRIKLLFFLNKLGCDQPTISYRLQEKLIQLKDDICIIQCDINYLRKFGIQNEKFKNLSFRPFFFSNKTFVEIFGSLSKMNF